MYYIVSLHQTTTCHASQQNILGCIISFLYIKPQLTILFLLYNSVVLYRFSTSNHNSFRKPPSQCSVVLYRFSTSNHNLVWPSLRRWPVVLYRFSTSNHNRSPKRTLTSSLYYIVSLHQTTTRYALINFARVLYYIVSLHQTTTYTTYILSNQLLDSPTG